MGKKAGHYLVVYDIHDIKRLRKVEKITENYCYRLQKSVMASNTDISQINIMKQQLEKVIAEDDYILIFSLCESDYQKMEVYGKLGGSDPANFPFLVL